MFPGVLGFVTRCLSTWFDLKVPFVFVGTAGVFVRTIMHRRADCHMHLAALEPKWVSHPSYGLMMRLKGDEGGCVCTVLLLLLLMLACSCM